MAEFSKEGDTTKETGKKSRRSVEEFLRKAVKRHNRVESSEASNRKEAVDDLKFKSGEQWDEADRSKRTTEKRPCLTINKMKTFVHQITNDQRQNRPAINVSPVGDKSDPQTAKMLKGLIRQIERASNADVAYDTAFDNAVSMGWGYFRIVTDYEDEDTFDQVIQIKRIRNPFRVYLDPDAQMPDGSDAKWCFISDLIERKEFEETYPDADPMAWEEGGIGDEYKSWSTSTHVRVSEYFLVENETRTLVRLANGHIGYWDDLDESLQRQAETDEEFVIDEREVRCPKIKWYKITAKNILDESEWVGKYIPIVRVTGDEIDVEGKVKLAGIVRDAKDAQRMYNYWRTSETEQIALAPKAPWIMEEGQIEGHETRWEQANIKSFPYLLYKASSVGGKAAPPPQRQQFQGPPLAITQAALSAAQDIQATTGIRFDATLQERTYDESGKALRELKRVGDLGNFHYVDNLSRALRHAGEILIDLIPKIYDTPRVLTILREDDGEERIKIDPHMSQPHGKEQLPDGTIRHLYNPKLGDYAVAVTIGPSFATKRAEAADSMLLFMKAVPQAAPMIGDLIAKNMDWPGADEIYARMASMLPPALQSKNLDKFPPEARGMVMSLMQQMQQLQAENQQAKAMLGDKERDRQLERESLQNEREGMARDFEAKMAKIIADMETKLAVAEAKQTASDPSAEFALKVEKIEKDFEAKMVKIVADLEAKRIDSDLAQVKESIKERDKERKETEKRKETEQRQVEVAEIAELAKGMKQVVEKLSKPRKKIGKFAGKTFEIMEQD